MEIRYDCFQKLNEVSSNDRLDYSLLYLMTECITFIVLMCAYDVILNLIMDSPAASLETLHLEHKVCTAGNMSFWKPCFQPSDGCSKKFCMFWCYILILHYSKIWVFGFNQQHVNAFLLLFQHQLFLSRGDMTFFLVLFSLTYVSQCPNQEKFVLFMPVKIVCVSRFCSWENKSGGCLGRK